MQVTGKTLTLLPKIPATSVIFTKPKMEIFQGTSIDGDEINGEDGIFYARVFLLKDLQVLYEMLISNQGVQAHSTRNIVIPTLKAGGNNQFIVERNIGEECLRVCNLCPPAHSGCYETIWRGTY
jgi:hypothetical protein